MHAVREGTVLKDRYRLDHALGRGSMGRVWQGLDLHLRRPVAVKTIALDSAADAEGRERFQRRFEREARAAAALDSANVATVHDADITGELHWLVMQLVEGATLGTVLAERERLDTASAVAVAAQISSGLAAAHAAGLIHRDLKPENIMIRRDGVVKILDFGLVKLMSDDGPRLTSTGGQVGNLLYASPELITGHPAPDGRSDLYSVGCLLHHLLSGVPPFPPLRADQPLAVIRGHLDGAPPPLAELGIEVPAELQALLSALLAKAPGARPGSAAEVYDALRPWLPGSAAGSSGPRAFGAEDPRRPFVLPQGPCWA
ncbi:serine/threonine-protein kinase [Streptomyces sp. CAU 1734]|uniref:serine/threonine-protein kinase n=1 Tax=Streptomyces sp. CAU 1734 TaxID=3140360 RepID=UPI0032608E7F